MPIQLTSPEKIVNDAVVARIVAVKIDRAAELVFMTIDFMDSNGDVVRSFEYETPLRDGFGELRIPGNVLVGLRTALYSMAQDDVKIPQGTLV